MDAYAANSWGWLALALVNAGLAEQKNRSRLAWFFLSLFLGPIATLLIVIWAPPETITDPVPPIQLSTGMLAIGTLLTLGGGILGFLAWTSELWALWVASTVLIIAALGCFVAFIVRRPADVVEARARLSAREE
ncbi:polyferredoxin [Mycetocola sp. CAN_C7]|uniref:hypothetical protein n=1 Tax=Mycetocola sp. CAN_C7 TaxID=2787724 RepID=UPI0018C97290